MLENSGETTISRRKLIYAHQDSTNTLVSEGLHELARSTRKTASNKCPFPNAEVHLETKRFSSQPDSRVYIPGVLAVTGVCSVLQAGASSRNALSHICVRVNAFVCSIRALVGMPILELSVRGCTGVDRRTPPSVRGRERGT